MEVDPLLLRAEPESRAPSSAYLGAYPIPWELAFSFHLVQSCEPAGTICIDRQAGVLATFAANTLYEWPTIRPEPPQLPKSGRIFGPHVRLLRRLSAILSVLKLPKRACGGVLQGPDESTRHPEAELPALTTVVRLANPAWCDLPFQTGQMPAELRGGDERQAEGTAEPRGRFGCSGGGSREREVVGADFRSLGGEIRDVIAQSDATRSPRVIPVSVKISDVQPFWQGGGSNAQTPTGGDFQLVPCGDLNPTLSPTGYPPTFVLTPFWLTYTPKSRSQQPVAYD
jgi:hypothetical protein